MISPIHVSSLLVLALDRRSITNFNCYYNGINDLKHQVRKIRRPGLPLRSCWQQISEGLLSLLAVLTRPVSLNQNPKTVIKVSYRATKGRRDIFISIYIEIYPLSSFGRNRLAA